MSQQPSDDKKLDFSTLPRGAIGIKGLPVSRNTRLPSIRSPRDLTLGAQPKRTFLPKIPVRREKKPPVSENNPTPIKTDSITATNSKNVHIQNDGGKGRGRERANIIQTSGSVFGEGIAASVLSRKDKMRESYQKSDFIVPPKSGFIKKEKGDEDIADITKQLDTFIGTNFIDDGEEDEVEGKPFRVFPTPKIVKKEEKKEVPEPASDFHQDIAKEMNFDVAKVAKFIKKEKGTEVDEMKSAASAEVPSNEITNILNSDVPHMILLKLPSCVTVQPRNEDTQMEVCQKSTTAEAKAANNQKVDNTSISSFPEGHIGKLQVLKSGRTRLLIGNNYFDLDSLSGLATKNHVVSIRTEGDTGDLTVLGFVDKKLTFSSNLETLL